MKKALNIIEGLAIAGAVASAFVSCGGNIGKADDINLDEAPMQRIENMFAVQTRNGEVTMRIEAPLMEKYENDSLSYDLFPNGLQVYGYTDDGQLETIIVSDAAKHTTEHRRNGDEIWMAFGNVIIHNVMKEETMETDTIYWDQKLKEIYTDCYVKMYSPDGFMQGYGMQSDDRARNAILNNPFNSYTVSHQDTTLVKLDSVNFIGPFMNK